MSVTPRIYQLHQLLKSKRQVTVQLLTERFEVSISTIRRDIALMRDQLNAPIIYNSAEAFYQYDPQAESFELPGLWFNESELYALLASEQLLEAVQPGLLTSSLEPLRKRINELLERSGHRSETVRSRITIQPIGHRQAPIDSFAQIAGALLQGRVIEFHYHSRGKDQQSQRVVHPGRLLYYRDNWYLIGWCEEAEALRNFSLDRVTAPHLLSRRSQVIEQQTIEQQIESGFGIFAGTVTDWAVLRFTPHMARWVADEQWHPEQRGTWRDDHHYELHIPYNHPTELLMDILKYGPEVEVVSPNALRQQIKERLEAALGQYQIEE